MRILHTSDWHLGQYFYGKTRLHEHQQFLTWLLTQVDQQQIEVIIVAGDIFDTGSPPSYARALYHDFVVQLQQYSCQLVVLAGNHDSVAMLAESQQLLAKLSTHVVTHVSQDTPIPLVFTSQRDNAQKVIVCAIPFIRARDVMHSSAGQSAQQKQQTLQQAISEYYQRSFQQAQQLSAAHNNAPIVMTGHLTTVGVSRSDSVRDIYIGSLEAFPANAFPAADYIALGHIHQAQIVAKQANIRYSGSPIALSFDELKQPKSVTFIDFKGAKTHISTVNIPSFQPMAMVKSTLDKLAEQLIQLAAELVDEQVMWLDIEIDSGDYLTDLQARVQAMIGDLPLEVLLLRRKKKTRTTDAQPLQQLSLGEISLAEVFANRLALESFIDNEGLARKQRLEQLFNTIVGELEQTAK